ncbi:intraflagellar transport protein 172 homolog [Planococcus citri]|uniref:intraflagellar transport protein 172 homolog n=1 Tax=Planococcus citri TaxID=170843 RepID=UPI0031F9824C
MQLKYLSTVIEAKEDTSKILAVAWSPNNSKLAVCNNERIVYLFSENGEKKDKFPTKPADSKNSRKSYSVKGLAFSPDSVKIAVGQTDNIIFVYRLGESWGDKKVICNKFPQQASVTCLIWLTEGPIIHGLADGKIRAAHLKSNKSQTLYSTGSYVVSLAANNRGTGFLSGHADGSIIRYFVTDDSTIEQQGRVSTHNVPPYALAWPTNYIFASGSDQIISVFGKDGRVHKNFDYSDPSFDEKEFSVACSSPSGQAVVVGSFNRLRLFIWSTARQTWEEGAVKELKNLYSVTGLSWRRDGSRVVCGSLCGALILFESILKKTVWKNKFEMTYVGPSQVLVKSTDPNEGSLTLKSELGLEINDVRIMGGDRYVVARTSDTLLLGDILNKLLSEVPWPHSSHTERFYFNNQNVCLIFNAGELTLVEYGNNEILTHVRTEFMNPHLISVRLNERKQPNSAEDNKKLAYLLDLKTICVVDLVFGVPIMQIAHDSKIDWLELNETGHKLLFRDKKMRLTLLDTRSTESHSILTYCTFVQWVPGSDVVVAQSRNNACVWYNIDTPDRLSIFPIKGEIMDIIRADGKTEILTQEGTHQYGYELDEGLVEFGTAVHDSDFGRAVLFLENLQEVADCPEAEGMWQNLAEIALQLHNLKVAERCYAALGDISRAHFLRVTLQIAEDYAKQNGGDGFDCPEVWARMAILNRQLKTAEAIYLEQNELNKALDMYKSFHKWDEAVALAESKNYQNAAALRTERMKWLLSTQQEEKAALLHEQDGDFTAALNLYLKAGLSAHAAKLVQRNPELLEKDDVIMKVISSLMKSEQYQLAGELYELVQKPSKALECYRKGHIYIKAVELAKFVSPKEVVLLEEEWGDYLVSHKQLDAAINHYIEAGKTVKALDAAVGARQWKKAVQIIQVIDDKKSVAKHYVQLAKHFTNIKDFKTAEQLFVGVEMYKDAIEMYTEAGDWEKAYALCSKYEINEEGINLLIDKGKTLEQMGKFLEAEKLYITLKQPDLAISMYKSNRQYDQMMRLVKEHHSDLVGTTHLHLAQQCEQESNYKGAEQHYIEGGEWKLAVKMYRSIDMWEDAYRVAKNAGGDQAGEQVAFLWAKSLGGESAVKLLAKLNLLDACIDHACDSYQFDFAFDLASTSAQQKLPDIHYKYAMLLEDEGKFKQAEEEFIKANKPKEAVLMYIHNKDWESAERVAEAFDDSAMIEVLVEQAKEEFQAKNYSRFESLLLRAHKPEMIISLYKENGLWIEALRICREYLPGHLNALQSEYQKEVGSKIFRDINSLMIQARQWEQNGEFQTAVDCYVKIVNSKSRDPEIFNKALMESARLIVKYLEGPESVHFAKIIGPKLTELNQHNIAAQVYLAADLVKESIDSFIDADDWVKARKVAAELDPSFESYITSRYKESLKKEGRTEQLADVDIIEALDLLCSQGQYSRCLEMAKPHGDQVLHKYVGLYAANLIKENKSLEAAELYYKYGTPAYPQNYNLYRRIVLNTFSSRNLDSAESYIHWARLRTVLFNLTEALSSTRDAIYKEFETLLLISHYYALRCACKNIPSLTPTILKISIALLRYTDIIPADKAYFEAGVTARSVGHESEAFVFLNHYLDLYEAIEENNGELVDHSDLEVTDFPIEVPIPEKPFLDSTQNEEVKEWVLTVSMNRNLDQSLPVDDRGIFEASLKCPQKGPDAVYPACIVTGWPVLAVYGGTMKGGMVEFKKGKHLAIKDEWVKLMMAVKNVSTSASLTDAINFIYEWCGTPPAFSFQ